MSLYILYICYAYIITVGYELSEYIYALYSLSVRNYTHNLCIYYLLYMNVLYMCIIISYIIYIMNDYYAYTSHTYTSKIAHACSIDQLPNHVIQSYFKSCIYVHSSINNYKKITY